MPSPGRAAIARCCATLATVFVLAACSSGVPSRRDDGAARRAGHQVRDLEFLTQYASTYRFRAGTPQAITVTPDGGAVLFLRSGPRSRVQDLYEFDVRTGRERVLLTADAILAGEQENLTPEELARRERMRQISRGISAYELSDDGARLLVPLSGRLFVVDRASGKAAELASSAGYPIDPSFSPDGRLVACVREGDLYVTDVSSGVERRLTTKAKDTITNGLAEFVAQEEMDRFRGYWWSPDSSAIAFEEADTEGLETFTIADPVNPQVAPNAAPYPRPGKTNARVRVGVVGLVGGAPAWISYDAARYEYLVSVRWPKGAPLTLVVMDRRQTEMAVLEADPGTGKTTALHVERDAAWINIDQGVPAWLNDGSAFLWTTERGGAWALELRSRRGEMVRTIAGARDGFLSLAHFDRASGVAHLGVTDDPACTHLARVNVLDESARPTRLTRGTSVHGLSAGKPLSTIVVSTSDPTLRRRWEVRRADGSVAGELSCVAEAPAHAPKVELATAGSREFRAAIVRPRDFSPGRSYPVILSVYAGPHVSVVSANAYAYVLNQWFADQGFVVVMLDGRGTPRRGREWERVIKGNLIDVALEDQVEGLRALGDRYKELDLSRVCVYGWSFGGYFSAMAAMRRPDAFVAGCAGAPVCDWRDYDTCYTERYLGLPETDPGAYDASNVLTYAKDLRVPLMIVHGTADDNVYFMHSLKMADALFRSGREYDFLVLPGFTHMVPDPVVTRSLYSRIAAYFLEHAGR